MAEITPQNGAGPVQPTAAHDAPLAASTEQDTAMTDAPGAAIVAPSLSSTPSTAPQPARTTTPQRNGLAPPPPATTAPAAAIPSKAPPHGARCRQYLNGKVTYVLLEGMKKVASEQPEDPLKMLGEFLLAKSKELEGT